MSPATLDRYEVLWSACTAVRVEIQRATHIHETEGPGCEREAVQLGEHVVPAALHLALRAAELEHGERDRWAAHLSVASRLLDAIHQPAVALDMASWARFSSARDLIFLAMQDLPVTPPDSGGLDPQGEGDA